MGTYTQILYQIVFSTKDRKNTLYKKNCDKLFMYIQGILKKKNCVLYKINEIDFNEKHLLWINSGGVDPYTK